MRRDTITGFDLDTPQTAFTEDPPARTDDVTPFLAEENSERVYRPPVAPFQDFPTRRPEPA